MSDEMSIETRIAKSIEHTYRNAVQRRPTRKTPSFGASLTKDWKSPDHPSEQAVAVLAAARKSAASCNGDRDGCDHQGPIKLDKWRSIIPPACGTISCDIIQPTSAIRSRSLRRSHSASGQSRSLVQAAAEMRFSEDATSGAVFNSKSAVGLRLLASFFPH